MAERITRSRRRGTRRPMRAAAVTVLAAAMGLTAAACGSSSKTSSTSTSSSSSSLKTIAKGPIDLTMWVLQSPVEVKTAEAQVKAFEKIHPNIHIKVEENAGAGNVEKQLAAAVAHTLPDILWSADVLTNAEAKNHILLNLSPYMKAYGYHQSQFVHSMMVLGQYKGNQYIVPRGIDQVVMAYNPKIFHMFGVPVPKEGITWDQFAKYGPELTKKVNGVQYYALSSYGFNINGYPIQEPAVRWYGGHFTNSAGTICTMDQPDAEKGLSKILDFSDKYSSLNAHLPTSAWLAGHAAMAWVVRPQIDGWLNSSGTGWSLPFSPNFVNFPLTEPHPQIGAGMSDLFFFDSYCLPHAPPDPGHRAEVPDHLRRPRGPRHRRRPHHRAPHRADRREDQGLGAAGRGSAGGGGRGPRAVPWQGALGRVPRHRRGHRAPQQGYR